MSAEPKKSMSPFKRIGVRAPLPDVSRIDLEGLEAKLPVARTPSSDELLQELRELQYRTALRVPRSLGEIVGPDDEVNVDTVGYCSRALVPFSVREGLMLGPEHDLGMPGMREATLGRKVGTAFIANLVIPAAHPIPHLRGKPVVFSVRINGASQMYAGAADSAEFLADAKMGDSIEAVFEKLAEEWIDGEAFLARDKALRHVLNTLATRSQVSVSPQLVDAEVGRRWRTEEGGLMSRLQLPMVEQETALAAWLENAEIRGDAARRLEACLVLRAVALQEKLTDAEGLRQTLDTLLSGLGIDASRVRTGFKNVADAKLNAQTVDSLIYMRASEFVWSKVKLLNA